MKTKIITITAIILISIPLMAAASITPHLYLTTEKSEVNPGENISVQINVRDIEPVYGTEITLSFNPEVLKVTDTDTDIHGFQIKPGTFFNHDRHYFQLQNHTDNTKGIIRYAASLLNPAPAAQGNGVVAEIIFQAKSPGKAELYIKNGKFGTRKGKTIVPVIESGRNFELAVAGHDTGTFFSDGISVIINPAIFITVLSGFVLWRLCKRKRENAQR